MCPRAKCDRAIHLLRGCRSESWWRWSRPRRGGAGPSADGLGEGGRSWCRGGGKAIAQGAGAPGFGRSRCLPRRPTLPCSPCGGLRGRVRYGYSGPVTRGRGRDRRRGRGQNTTVGVGEFTARSPTKHRFRALRRDDKSRTAAAPADHALIPPHDYVTASPAPAQTGERSPLPLTRGNRTLVRARRRDGSAHTVTDDKSTTMIVVRKTVSARYQFKDWREVIVGWLEGRDLDRIQG